MTRYELKENFTLETALEFGRLYKKSGDWRFQAVGQGYKSGLRQFC
ncbi:MAG: TerD family protein [Microcoleus sp.]